MHLSPEITGLLIGLAFSIAVFAFKTAVGEFYFLVNAVSWKQKTLFLLLSTAAYGLLFFLAFLLLSLFPETRLFMMERREIFQAGIALHLLVAAGFFLWGILLLLSKADERKARGWWLLAVPCPVCASAIFLAVAFAELLLPESKRFVRIFVPGVFFFVNFLVLGGLRFSIGKWNLDPRRLTGRLMVFVGLYFAGLLLLVPNFDRIEQMYRIVAGKNGFPQIDWLYMLPVPVIFLTGAVFQIKRGNREC